MENVKMRRKPAKHEEVDSTGELLTIILFIIKLTGGDELSWYVVFAPWVVEVIRECVENISVRRK